LAKLTLQDVLSWFNSGPTIAANNRAIEAAIENTLSRDGTSPNDMDADLDMGGHRVTNLAAPVEGSDAVRLQDIMEGIEIIQTVPWDEVTDKPIIVSALESYSEVYEIRRAPVVTVSDSNLDASPEDEGNYTRFSNSTATYTFSGDADLVEGAEYHGRYVGDGTLTITEADGMTINPPAEGTLVIPPGGTFTVKIISSTEADLFGVTELAE
jgi:hypothetical protein